MRKVRSPNGSIKRRKDKPSKETIRKIEQEIPRLKVETKKSEKELPYDEEALLTAFDNYTRLPRLLSAAKEFNLGQDKIIDFLVSVGEPRDEMRPTSKLSTRGYIELLKAFDPERIKQYKKTVEHQVDDANEITISFLDGKLIVRKLRPDGSIVWATGVDTVSGFFIPHFNRYSEIIKEFEELINDLRVTEAALQEFLERNPEFIKESDFKEAIPQAVIVTEEHNWEADFVLVPFEENELCKIIELKLPEVSVERSEKNGHARFTIKLLHAIQQLKDYSKAFQSRETRKKFQERYGTDVYRPDLQLIIGRKGNFKFKDTFVDKQKDEGLRITDWDTLLEKVKRKFA